MLTEEEKIWLADGEQWNFKRDIYGLSCFCPSCKHCEHFTETANGVFCQDAEDMWIYDKPSKCPLVPSKELLVEAAEFEQRVAAKLARMSADVLLPCFQTSGDCPYTIPNCAWCRLMVARLQVEEEMDNGA